MSKVIAIANFKGGCGKTTSAIDLSAAFARLGKKVLTIDSDGQGHLAIGFGFSKNQKVTLKNMLENEIMGFEYDPTEAILHTGEAIYKDNTDPADNHIFHTLVLRECDIRPWLAVRRYDIRSHDMLLGVRRIRFLVSGSYSIYVIHSYRDSSRLAY